jgi:hypothetical protein
MNQLSDAIKCVNCRNVLEKPVSLPCGCSICEKHTQNVSGAILCCSCEIDHKLPDNGRFPPTKALNKILEAQFSTIDFGKEHNGAKLMCSRLEELLANIDNIIKDPFNFTYEVIEYLKNVAQLKVDETKLQLDNNLACLITKLDEFKAKTKENFKSFEYLSQANELSAAKESTRLELNKWLFTLNELKLNEPEWKRIKNESKNTIERFKFELEKFKGESLLENRFDKFRDEIENKFGEFEIDPKFW